MPGDIIPGLKVISDPEVRESAGVNPENPFLFPYTQNSLDHVSGPAAINQISRKAGVHSIQLTTATKMRHKISTDYALLDLPDREKELFYNHMGHSKEMNINVYQTPLALMTLAKVGTQLHRFDKGMFSLPVNFIISHRAVSPGWEILKDEHSCYCWRKSENPKWLPAAILKKK